MKKTIIAHIVVKNEDRTIYFAMSSIIGLVDEILVWDTGSNDLTVSIIKLLQKEYPKKIIFEEKGEVDSIGLTKLRQEMLNQTKSDWFFILDGDEVWWEKSLKKIINTINEKGDDLYAIVNPSLNILGDIYHYQEEKAGKYEILGKKGHLNIRAINRKIPGLHIKGNYPLEAFYDSQGRKLQKINDKLQFVDAPYLHFTYLKRSSVGENKKYKFETGITFPKNFKYPEVFYKKHPILVPSPWIKRNKLYVFRALLETPIKKLKRRLL